MNQKVLNALNKIAAGITPEARKHLDDNGLVNVEAEFTDDNKGGNWHFTDKSDHKEHIGKRLKKMSPEFWAKLNKLQKSKKA